MSKLIVFVPYTATAERLLNALTDAYCLTGNDRFTWQEATDEMPYIRLNIKNPTDRDKAAFRKYRTEMVS
jgi:hypothetical protein